MEEFALPEAPRAKAGWAIRLLVVLGVLLPLAGCAAAAVVARGFIHDFTRVENLNLEVLASDDAVLLGPDGRYLLMQGCDWKNNPRVFTYDLESSKLEMFDGYRMVSFDPSSSIAWLVKDPGVGLWGTFALRDMSPGERRRRLFVDGACDSFDGPASGLVQLDVTTGKLSDVGAIVRQPWIGSAGYSVAFEMDASVGVWPKRIFVEGLSGSREIPPLWESTVRPIGWSADGRYFAVVGLVPRTVLFRGEDLSYDATVTAYVLDSVEATVAGTFEVYDSGSLLDVGPFWESAGDTLCWTQRRRESGQIALAYSVRDALVTTVTPVANSSEGWVLVAGSWQPGVVARVLGAASEETTGTRVVYELRDGTLVDQVSYPVDGVAGIEIAWSRKYGLIEQGITKVDEPDDSGFGILHRVWQVRSDGSGTKQILDMGKYPLITRE